MDYSRIKLFTDKVTNSRKGLLQKRLERLKTIVSLEPDLAGSVLTASLLCETLGRLPGEVFLNASNLPGSVSRLIQDHYKATHGKNLGLAAKAPQAAGFINVHIGREYKEDAIRAIPEGFGGHILNSGETVTTYRDANALGSFFTSALAAAEIFKKATNLATAGRAEPFTHLSFCPVTLSEDLSLAPDLPENMQIDVGVFGVGAIGTAITLLLSLLSIRGRVVVVDNQQFSEENFPTYSIGTKIDIRRKSWKVEIARRSLKKFDVKPHRGDISSLATLVDSGKIPWPDFVFSSLDSVDSRHAAQRLWPNYLIDPATGDTIVGINTVKVKQPCLMCFLAKITSEKSSIVKLAELTGLDTELLRSGDTLLEPDHISNLSMQKKKKLKKYIGQPVCGLTEAYGLIGSEEDFRASIPFASQQAASLAVGRMLSIKLGTSTLDNLFQYDVFRGPLHSASKISRVPRDGCYCQTHSKVIDAVRAYRRKLSDESRD